MVNELNHFFSCIKNKKDAITNGFYAQKIVKILEDIDNKAKY
jgi:hypothetical protein